MSRPDLCLSIRLLSEDASQEAHATLAALTKSMLKLLEPGCQTQRIELEPASEQEARAVHGNVWKSRNPRDHQRRTDLIRTIATKLMEARVPGFVFFHVDADRRWSERESCENRSQFEERIRLGVEQRLVESGVPKAEREAALARLVLMMPFWCIEAWVYQNTQTAIWLCREHHGGADVGRFEAWEKDRAALDEVPQPKEEVCLRDRHNRELAAEGYPANDVWKADASFAAAVHVMLDVQDLCAALERTRA